jgi:hypothetical protein
MTRRALRLEVEVDAPAAQVWERVTDWPAQGEWIPHTHVENVPPDGPPARHVGGRLRAWSGLGPVGFWDTMTITHWDEDEDGGGRCEVLHTGRVVRGEGVFAVEALGPRRCRFVWEEVLELPLGRLGDLGFRGLRPGVERLVQGALDTLRDQVSASGGDVPGD